MKFTFSPESRVLDGYTIKRAIYRGGFGEVYYALSDAGREVALKLLQNNTEIELRGVRQCLNLSHPNLVTIFDVRTDADGDHWIIMEYVAGETLESAIRRHPDGMPMEEVRRWMKGLAAGVSFLHSRGLVHRDMKPANVFMEEGTVKVGDVGLSKFITPSRRSAQTQSVGTVYYMAPEVAKGRYGKEVDIYALGVILYEMLTGRVPFDGESTGEILMKHLSEKPDLDKLPPRVRPVLAQALEKDPEKRFRSVTAFERAFENAVVGKSGEPEYTEVTFLGEADTRVGVVKETAFQSRTHYSQPGLVPPAIPSRQDPGRVGFLPTARGLWLIFVIASVAMIVRGIDPNAPEFFFGMIGLTWIGYTLLRHWRGPLVFEEGTGARRWSFLFPRGMGRVWIGVTAVAGMMAWMPSRNQGMWFLYAIQGAMAGYAALLFVHAVRPATSPPPAREGSPPPLPEVGRTKPTRPRTGSRRAGEWLTSATLTPLFIALFTAGIAAVAPSQFWLGRVREPDPGVLALFSVTLLVAAWLLTLVLKVTEGKPGTNDSSSGLRRSLLATAGLATGATAWGLTRFLQFDAAELFVGHQVDGLFTSLGERDLIVGTGDYRVPTLMGYLIFFGGLFALRSWGRQVDVFRERRFSATSVLMTALIAWLWSAIFAFPQAWAMLWGASLSATVQLTAAWVGPKAGRMGLR